MVARRKLALVMGGIICLAAFFFLALDLLFPPPALKPYSVVITDGNNHILQVFRADDGIWRVRTHPEEIPAKLKKILIQKEDRFFYYHPGINPFSICRALLQNIILGKRASGASTITMQVARMLDPKKRTYPNKIIEMFRAVQLEFRYSKNQILEMYLSMVPLGGNIEGLKTAALLYYQTPPERLNIAQLFDLILIPNDPNDLRPDRFPDRLLQERKRRALPWIKRGALTRLDSVILWQTASGADRKQMPRRAPQFCLRVKEKIRGNDEICSSLDLRMQEKIEKLLANHLQIWKQKGVMNGAALVINNRTREILAYAGSDDFNDLNSHGQVDAVKALNSPGSTLKPFLYALQMDRGLLTPKTRLLDTPYDAEGFYAENYDGRYSGLVYADEALRRSLNVPMIRLLREAGFDRFVDFAEEAGFSSLRSQREKLGLSMIVGGCGVTLEELTNAYASFPAGGVYLQAGYLKVQRGAEQQGKKIFSPSSAYMVTEILSGLDRPDLPNNFESSLNLPKVAFKTGTSYGRRDAWSIGYSSEYTVGVWVGNVTHVGSPELTGGRTAAPLLIDIFNSISPVAQKSIMSMPADVQMRDVCANSGLLTTRRCSHSIEDYYSVRFTQDRYCEFDKECLVSPDGKTQYCSSCLGANHYKTATYEDYPPELLSFWDQIGMKYKPIPPHNAFCSRLFTGTGPKITSPSDAMTYYLASQKQPLALQASSGLEVREHTWFVDERFLKRDRASTKLFVPLSAGVHTISCVDDHGRTSAVKINVKFIN